MYFLAFFYFLFFCLPIPNRMFQFVVNFVSGPSKIPASLNTFSTAMNLAAYPSLYSVTYVSYIRYTLQDIAQRGTADGALQL